MSKDTSSVRAAFLRSGLVKPAHLCKPTNIVKGGDGNWHIVPDFVKV